MSDIGLSVPVFITSFSTVISSNVIFSVVEFDLRLGDSIRKFGNILTLDTLQEEKILIKARIIMSFELLS